MKDLYVVAIVYAKQGQESSLRDDLAVLVEPSRRDEGNLGYELFVDRNDARRFVFVEHWTDAAAQRKHHEKGPHILHFHANGAAAVERTEFYALERIA